jgi:hypothetical protein
MQVIYKKLEEPKKKNCYEFEFSFEHGDADSHNTDLVICENMNEEQLIAYVKKSEEISDMIEESRSGGKDLPKNFYELAVSNGFDIPVERDNYAKMHISNYYASSGLNKIFYYDENGAKFKVTVN